MKIKNENKVDNTLFLPLTSGGWLRGKTLFSGRIIRLPFFYYAYKFSFNNWTVCFTFLSLMSEMKPTYSFNIHSKNEVTVFEIHVFMSSFTQKWLNIRFLLFSSIYVFMLYLQMNLFLEKKKQGQKKSKILVNTC